MQMTDLRTTLTRRRPTRRQVALRSSRSVGRPDAALGALLGAACAASLVLLPLTLGVPIAAVLLVTLAVLLRRPIGDLVAGATLLFVRPYAPGELIRVRLDAAEDVVSAEVLEIRPLRTVLCTATGMLAVRNADLLRTAPTVPTVPTD